MSSLKNLTRGQLAKMLVNAEAEIKRRENTKEATAEIQAVLNKHNLTIQDIDLSALNKRIARNTKNTKKAQSRALDKRKRVKVKYANPKGTEVWSGRGRAPAWVVKLCQEEGIDLAAFKKDGRFLQN